MHTFVPARRVSASPTSRFYPVETRFFSAGRNSRTGLCHCCRSINSENEHALAPIHCFCRANCHAEKKAKYEWFAYFAADNLNGLESCHSHSGETTIYLDCLTFGLFQLCVVSICASGTARKGTIHANFLMNISNNKIHG